MRKLVLSALFLAALVSPSLAGDFAERRIIGFSEDGSRFAFEEFGVQAGSGFPYANLFVIDTRNDQWVEGTPIRILEEDETVPLASVRQRIAAEAQPFVGGLDQPGSLLASNPITETGRDPYRIAFKRWPELLLESGDLHLTLETIPLESPANTDDEYRTYGFRLKLDDGQSVKLIHEDKALPASRGVPLDYRIADVVIHQPFGEPATLAVLVLVIQRGFEGARGRFLAVTTRLDD